MTTNYGKIFDHSAALNAVVSNYGVEAMKPIAYAISKNLSLNGEVVKEFRERQRQILMKFAKKDDKGSFVLDDNNNHTFESDETREKAEDEYQKLLKEDVEVNYKQVKEDVASRSSIKSINLLPLYEFMVIPNKESVEAIEGDKADEVKADASPSPELP